MKAPDNTSLQPAAFIEAQEKAGQISFVGSDTLPTEMDQADRQALEAQGVRFHDVVADDPLFTYVTLPEGWTKQAHEDHSMWSSLLDAQGTAVASMFYKAAFYDRRAFLRMKGQ